MAYCDDGECAWTGRKAATAKHSRGWSYREVASITGAAIHHYEFYVERLQPVIDDINRRYPVMAPADLDPDGESWDEDAW